MTAASTVESSARFLKSQSCPDLFSLPNSFDNEITTGLATDTRSLADSLVFQMPSFDNEFRLDTSLFVHDQSSRPTRSSELDSTVGRTIARETQDGSVKPLKQPSSARLRAASIINRPRSWLLAGSKAPKDIHKGGNHQPPSFLSASHKNASEISVSSEAPRSRSNVRGLPVSASLVNLAKLSIRTPSRTPSPKPTTESTPEKASSSGPSSKASKEPPERLQPLTEADLPEQANQPSEASKSTLNPLARTGSYLAKMKPKLPVLKTGPLDGTSSDVSCASSSINLGNCGSGSDGDSASQSTCSDETTNTPVSDDSSPEHATHVDPLWSSFKDLDLKYKLFTFKHVSQRVVQIESQLVPLLRSSMHLSAVRNLTLECVDRRARVLNKWWDAILDMLLDQSQHQLCSMDRSVLLEAATLLMMRPEWRQAATCFLPLCERSPAERVRSRSSTSSTRYQDPDAPEATSVEHSVTIMFLSNLVKQTRYSVDRMSMRYAPKSIVDFAGKTCAYAFLFAPGVADVLVRLWGLTPELIRRTADSLGLPREDRGESEDLTALFPPKLSSLAWTTPRGTWEVLKRVPLMSSHVAKVSWTGPWVTRWKGRDTDLFFIFCKYFHLLSDQFMPRGLPLMEKARAPAFVLVHAQLLSVVDSTIHRQTALQSAYGVPALDGADASALATPLPPTNLMRSMTENRLVTLLKDLLADASTEVTGARDTFAETFTLLMEASARRTSQFDSAACFTLCDFLEEVITIYHEAESAGLPASFIDWNFWLDVCRRIMSTHNTMSEVRVLSLLYTIWEAVARDAGRKQVVCSDWLLTEQSFNTFFSNWCPMVRAYYQRLLCWRICRHDENSSPSDLKIMLAVSSRLRSLWSNYLTLKRRAEEAARLPPSIMPTCPTPGKKLMIIRQEVRTPQPDLLMGFDNFAKMGSDNVLSWNDVPDANASDKVDSKKRWSLLGKVLSMTTGNSAIESAGAEETCKKGSSTDTGSNVTIRSMKDAQQARSATPPSSTESNRAGRPGSASPESHTRSSSPSREGETHVFKFLLGWPQQAVPAIGRDLARPRLPAPAQARVAAELLTEMATPPDQTQRPELRPGAEETAADASGVQGSLSASIEEWLSTTSATLPARNVATSAPRLPQLEESCLETRPQVVEGYPGAAADEKLRRLRETLTRPVKPVDSAAGNSTYSGRALAEWTQVVTECNNFIERRRHEGIEKLEDMEVPRLGVEGFRKPGC